MASSETLNIFTKGIEDLLRDLKIGIPGIGWREFQVLPDLELLFVADKNDSRRIQVLRLSLVTHVPLAHWLWRYKASAAAEHLGRCLCHIVLLTGRVRDITQ